MTVAATITRNGDASISVTWASVGASTTGDPYTAPAGYELKAVHLRGTFGGTIVLQASLDGTNYMTAEDCASTAISATAEALFNVKSEAAAWRPSSGVGVTAVDVIAYFAPRG